MDKLDRVSEIKREMEAFIIEKAEEILNYGMQIDNIYVTYSKYITYFGEEQDLVNNISIRLILK